MFSLWVCCFSEMESQMVPDKYVKITMAAIEDGVVGVIKYLLKSNSISVNDKIRVDSKTVSILAAAVNRHQPEIVQCLIDNGANIMDITTFTEQSLLTESTVGWVTSKHIGRNSEQAVAVFEIVLMALQRLGTDMAISVIFNKRETAGLTPVSFGLCSWFQSSSYETVGSD